MQLRSEETRARILQTAYRLFSQQGYDATGVAQICSEAGVSKGAFYHHFQGKHNVFMSLLESWLNNLNVEMTQLTSGATTVPQTFIQMTAALNHIFRDARGHLPMFLEFWTQSSRDPQVWQATVAPYRSYQSYFTGLLQQGVDEGSIDDGHVDDTARVIIALALGVILQGLLEPESANGDRTAQKGMELIMEALSRRSK